MASTKSSSEVFDYSEIQAIEARLLDLTGSHVALSEEAREQSIDELRTIIWGRDHRNLRFPIKLHRLACCAAIPDIYWVGDGKSLTINKNEYKRNIMKVFFNQNNLRCIQSLLCKYGFRSVSDEPAHADFAGHFLFYTHPKFLPGREDLAKEIGRVKRPSQSSSSSLPSTAAHVTKNRDGGDSLPSVTPSSSRSSTPSSSETNLLPELNCLNSANISAQCASISSHSMVSPIQGSAKVAASTGSMPHPANSTEDHITDLPDLNVP